MDTLEALTQGIGLSREKAIVAANILNALPETCVHLSSDDVIIATIAIGIFHTHPEHGLRWCQYYRGLPPVEVLSNKKAGSYVLVSFDWNPTPGDLNPKIVHIEATRQNKPKIKANIIQLLSGKVPQFDWAFLTKGGEKLYLRR
jgi:hypothetical protein